MAAKLLYSAVLCFLSLTVAQLRTVNGRLKIQIHTTANCSDTITFITDHLAPTYTNYKEFLDVEFVPWGRATREEDDTLRCQFGPNDCWANRLQRCALDLLKGNQDAQIDYMTCEMTSPFPSLYHSYQCANDQGLKSKNLDYCLAHRSEELERRDEDIGVEHLAQLDFVPSLVFNQVIDPDLHKRGYDNFQYFICSALAGDASTGVKKCEIEE